MFGESVVQCQYIPVQKRDKWSPSYRGKVRPGSAELELTCNICFSTISQCLEYHKYLVFHIKNDNAFSSGPDLESDRVATTTRILRPNFKLHGSPARRTLRLLSARRSPPVSWASLTTTLRSECHNRVLVLPPCYYSMAEKPLPYSGWIQEYLNRTLLSRLGVMCERCSGLLPVGYLRERPVRCEPSVIMHLGLFAQLLSTFLSLGSTPPTVTTYRSVCVWG